jgi:hypothetical protein
MYGGILVEAVGGLSPVEKEFYVVQSEFYTKPGKKGETLAFSFENGLAEHPSHVVFNGMAGALVKNPLMAKVGDTIRMFYINAGPNLTANWHVMARNLTGYTPRVPRSRLRCRTSKPPWCLRVALPWQSLRSKSLEPISMLTMQSSASQRALLA